VFTARYGLGLKMLLRLIFVFEGQLGDFVCLDRIVAGEKGNGQTKKYSSNIVEC
jgi:hypothetical protein